jgi:hypothetical protein
MNLLGKLMSLKNVKNSYFNLLTELHHTQNKKSWFWELTQKGLPQLTYSNKETGLKISFTHNEAKRLYAFLEKTL